METALLAPCDSSPFDANITLGPLGIDYVHIYYCTLADLPLLSFSMLLLWLCCLFYFLGSTADGYFSPTLASLSDRLRVPHNVAGVTFLAIGNGAPDVFSAIAAYSSGVGETGVNELLGGAMFVSTVVVGGVAIASDVKVKRWAFLRDAGALIITLVIFMGLAVSSRKENLKDTALAAVIFLVMYGLYVGSVVLEVCLKVNSTIANTDRDAKVEGENSLMMSAYWHALSPRGKNVKRASRSEPQYDLKTKLKTEEYSGRTTNENGGGDTLGIDESIASEMTSLHFSSRVFDDHFEVEEEDSLSSPLIAYHKRDGISDDQVLPEWQKHLRWRWRLRRRVVQLYQSDNSLVVKILHLPQALLMLARDLTVPLFDNEAWSRPKACLSLVTVPLLVAMTSNYASADVLGGRSSYRLLLWQAILVLGSCACAVASFFTHRSHAPRSVKASILFLSTAFIACVVWIYAAANELVALLTAVGYITHASNSLLGLTVLAWGNSVGDLITNVSVARSGFPQMAIAGCFGGPVFNILLGMGLPMAFAFISGRSEFLSLDIHAWTSLTFLFVYLVSSLSVFRHYEYHCPAWYGKTLMVYYIIYSLLNVFFALQVGQM
ncbi:putative sodium/calcium exchanger membrane region [Plasmopara halstedii]